LCQGIFFFLCLLSCLLFPPRAVLHTCWDLWRKIIIIIFISLEQSVLAERPAFLLSSACLRTLLLTKPVGGSVARCCSHARGRRRTKLNLLRNGTNQTCGWLCCTLLQSRSRPPED
jgi:hypothetical protein